MSSSYRLSLENWISTLDVKADKVLDIGGSQLPVNDRTQSWDVKKYIISDLADPHVSKQRPDFYFDLNTDKWKPRMEKYDVVFCLEVMEYIYNPINAMQAIADFMVTNGTAWVSFPSVYPLHQPVEDDALRYFPGGIVKIVESAGLAVEQMIKRRPETNKWMEFCSAERLRAAKNEDHNFTGFICELSK